MSFAWTDLAAWLGTYLVHSTVVLGLAWIAFRLTAVGAAAREKVWKCALVLPFVTAAVQIGWPERVVAPRIELAAAPAAPLDVDALLAEIRTLSGDASETARPAAADDVGLDAASAAPLALLLLLAIAVGVPSVRLALALRRRRRVTEGVIVEEVEALRRRAGLARRVRVTVSDRVGSPVAIGTLRPEICVPRRALDLPRPMARALVAHELAHHARLDPLWTRFAHAIAAVLFVQPLNRVARRELLECAELLADDLAVEWTDDRFGLARCLTEVAGWARPDAPASAAVAMVRRSSKSTLRERVERALDRPREGVVRGLAPLAVVLGLTVAATAPGFAREPRHVGAAEAAIVELRAELRLLAAELRVLGDHPDPAVRERAATLAVRRVQLQATAEHLARALSPIAREADPTGDPIR